MRTSTVATSGTTVATSSTGVVSSTEASSSSTGGLGVSKVNSDVSAVKVLVVKAGTRNETTSTATDDEHGSWR